MENIHLQSGCETGRFKVSSTTACRFFLFLLNFDREFSGQSQGTVTAGTFSLVVRSLVVGLTILLALEVVVDMWSLSNMLTISDAFCSCRLDEGASWLNADPVVLEKRASYLISRFKSEINLFINL